MAMNCNNSELNKAFCHKCVIYKKVQDCKEYNKVLPAKILEPACHKVGYNETAYNPDSNSIRCKDCDERSVCRRVLSPYLANAPLLDANGRYRKYSEFSGCTVVHAPNYLTFDLQNVQDVQTIQFLLWDNRGNNKDEACDTCVHYRLLVSSHASDLTYNLETSTLSESDGSPASVCWQVLYDTLRHGYNGWQVFHLDQPIKVRYVRLHLISNSEENKRCSIVRFGAYRKQLIGFELYQHLPTLVRTLYTAVSTPNAEEELKIDLHDDTIAKFPKELRNLVQQELGNKRGTQSKKYVSLLNNLNNELNIIISELQQHDKRILLAKNEIHKNTHNILSYAGQVMWASILWFVVSTGIGWLTSERGYDISEPIIYRILVGAFILTLLIIIPWQKNPLRLVARGGKRLLYKFIRK